MHGGRKERKGGGRKKRERGGEEESKKMEERESDWEEDQKRHNKDGVDFSPTYWIFNNKPHIYIL